MAEVIPFVCWRPRPDIAAEVAATPYDTLSRAETAEEIAAHPLSFLNVDKPAALFGSDIDEYDPCVYTRAREILNGWYEQGIMELDQGEQSNDTSEESALANTSREKTSEDSSLKADTSAVDALKPSYFIYRLTQGSHAQTGVMACVSVEDYDTGVIKRHENTRALKEEDRIEHIKALAAHTGPVLLTYPGRGELDQLLASITNEEMPLYDFSAPDGVHHEFWRVDNQDAEDRIRTAFADIPALYIADGHHRAAAAAQVAKLYSPEEYPESQHFLALVVSSNEMQVLDYNRVISDLDGMSVEELLKLLSEVVTCELQGESPYKPQQRGEFGMYLDGQWYKLTLDEHKRPDDAVEGLDVALLHELILEPLLGIDDPRSNPRIAYVGGIRGLEELSERASKTDGVAFALYPCSLEELFAVADANRLMPPKSTWFEPKPRSGLAIHRITG